MRALAVALALTACGVSTDAPAFAYSHTVSFAPELVRVHSESPAVRLLCPGADELRSECDCSREGVDVYATANAGEGQPFGVASYVEVEACE